MRIGASRPRNGMVSSRTGRRGPIRGHRLYRYPDPVAFISWRNQDSSRLAYAVRRYCCAAESHRFLQASAGVTPVAVFRALCLNVHQLLPAIIIAVVGYQTHVDHIQQNGTPIVLL